MHGWKSAVYIIFYVNCIYSELVVRCGFANNFRSIFVLELEKMNDTLKARGFNTAFYGKLQFIDHK